MSVKRAWTEAEISHAKQMELLGHSFAEIGAKLGRSRSSVVNALRPRAKTAQCVDCGKAVFAGSKTGRCRSCKNVYLGANPEFCKARAEGVRRKWSDDAQFASKMRRLFRQIGRENGTNPERRAKLVEHGHRMISHLHSPESIAKRDYAKVAASLVEYHMGWCPEEYRAEYKRLTESKRLLAHEARAVILAQVKADIAKLSPFERQQYYLERGRKLADNDRGPMFGEVLKVAG